VKGKPMVQTNQCREGLFLSLIRSRLAYQTKSAIGRELGVCPISVERWIAGKRRPSRTVVLLAELLWGTAVEMPPGLPSAARPAGS
jgi:hypothetical protein